LLSIIEKRLLLVGLFRSEHWTSFEIDLAFERRWEALVDLVPGFAVEAGGLMIQHRMIEIASCAQRGNRWMSLDPFLSSLLARMQLVLATFVGMDFSVGLPGSPVCRMLLGFA